MGYFSAFWSSSRWQNLLTRVKWYLQSSNKSQVINFIIEVVVTDRFHCSKLPPYISNGLSFFYPYFGQCVVQAVYPCDSSSTSNAFSFRIGVCKRVCKRIPCNLLRTGRTGATFIANRWQANLLLCYDQSGSSWLAEYEKWALSIPRSSWPTNPLIFSDCYLNIFKVNVPTHSTLQLYWCWWTYM